MLNYILNRLFGSARKVLSIILIIGSFTTLASDPIAHAGKLSAKRIVTENGLTLLIQEMHSLPVVQIETIIRAGAVLDPDDKAGLAYLTAALLDEGTPSRISAEIAEAVDFMGARLSTAGEEDYATASLRILKKDLDDGLELFSDILLRPAFTQTEFERERQETLGRLVAEKDQPGVVAMKAFNEIVFGPHPYHRPAEGLEDTLPAISVEDIHRFHDTYYRPNNTIMAIVGDVTEQEVLEAVQKYFGDWEPRPVPAPTLLPAGGLKETVIKLIDKDLTQANIVMGHLGINRSNPDYYAVFVMNYILGGGGFSSRLLGNIRDNQGLAYSIYSHFNARTFPGSFRAVLQTRNATAREAIDGVLSELRRIRDEPVSGRELSEARSFLIGNFPLRIDTTSKVARLLSLMEYHDLGLDYAEQYPKLIGAVTKTDIQRVARKYLNPDRLALVVVAKQEEARITEE